MSPLEASRRESPVEAKASSVEWTMINK
jgi:hypothetical protein